MAADGWGGHVCSFAGDGGVESGEEGVVDYAYYGGEVYAETEGDTGPGEGVDEVGSSVYWVDDECWGGGEGVAGFVGFFAHESGLQERIESD